jgi:hypothetical protein
MLLIAIICYCIVVGIMEQPTDLITTNKARKLLGIGPVTMSRLLKEGVVRYYLNPLDKRVKLVSESELLALKPRPAEAA